MENIFRTPVKVKRSDIINIDHNSAILTLGSCFSTEIGTKLRKSLFNTCINPFGALYNPVSIANAINIIEQKKIYSQQDLCKDGDGLWHSFDHHSDFSTTVAEDTIDLINSNIKKAYDFISLRESVLILTLGSSRGFMRLETGKIVANCHKYPSKDFEIIDFQILEITEILQKAIEKLKSINPEIKIIFTVSPVRHKAYGLHADKLSKATLLIAVESIISTTENCDYFPSYEILMDDLRDYRFYDTDMIHPSDLAVEYIYRRFIEMFCTKEEHVAIANCEDLVARKNHKILKPETESARRFLNDTEKIERALASRFPHIPDALKSL